MFGKKKDNFLIIQIISTLTVVPLFCFFLLPQASGDEQYNRSITHYPYRANDLTVIGETTTYTIQAEDTFLDISRKYELGYNEMAILYPLADPWMPPAGENVTIPSFWVLPPATQGQLVINIPELRLYFFEKETSCVQTYPVSIGIEGWETPPGNFSITEKRSNPTWYIPQSLQEKYGMAVMPPGPGNPLGKYVMRFSNGSYSIHGTHMPWGVGRLISHGCIRCYPEHIGLIYPQVALGTKVEIVYEPIKFGQKKGRIFVEIHPDVYSRIPDFGQYAEEKLKNFRMADQVDPSRYELAVRLRNGMPVDVSLPLNTGIQNVSVNKLNLSEAKPPSEGEPTKKEMEDLTIKRSATSGKYH